MITWQIKAHTRQSPILCGNVDQDLGCGELKGNISAEMGSAAVPKRLVLPSRRATSDLSLKLAARGGDCPGSRTDRLGG